MGSENSSGRLHPYIPQSRTRVLVLSNPHRLLSIKPAELMPFYTGADNLDVGTREEIAALANRASISGVQRKLFAVLSANGFRPAKAAELSTHIAKLPSPDLNEVVELEYLTTVAAAALLPDDVVVELEITEVENVQGPCLLVRRFDRTPTGDKIHFEEFNQLLERPAEARYEGSYGEMAMFIPRHQRYH